MINTLDSKSTQKLNLKSLEKSPIINLNQPFMNNNQAEINAITDFSKKSSPHNKQISDIPNKFSLISNSNNMSALVDKQNALKIMDTKKSNYSNNSSTVNQNQNAQKNNSKSPRIEEKSDFLIKKKVEETKKSENSIKNNIQNSTVIKNSLNNNNNILNPYKKHSTSTNSPKHILLNFKKEVVITNNFVKEISKNDKISSKNNNSISTSQRHKDDQISKPIISLKLNLNNLKQPNVNEIKKKKESNLDLSNNKSLDNILETSNCSVKSTLRESNYYRKEAEKLSYYVKNCN